MSFEQAAINLQNDISLVYKIINETFSKFYKNEECTELNISAYFNFIGIEEDVILGFYESSSTKYIFKNAINAHELFVIFASIAPQYYPDIFRSARYLQRLDEGSFSMLGGKIIGDNKCFYPSGETILFLLAGHDITKRIMLSELLNPGSKLSILNFIELRQTELGLPPISGQIYPKAELLSILSGKNFRPEYTSEFPAARIETRMEWEDLVLPYDTHEDLEELKIWMEHGQKLIQHKDLGKRLKPGYRTLFYGPPGTGKTLTASLIGKSFGVDVYRIDLSMVVSKWVGETEKNLKNIFDLATNKNWILFFDEAESLFGKRTNNSSSNDRYANQEVSYLLQRIEDFPGLVILASNLKSNIDEAFNRRFQSAILFPMPDAEIRYILWKKAFPSDFPLEAKIDLHKIAAKYELAGGAIINIIRYCVLKSMHRDNNEILLEDIEHSIIREFKKEGKIVS